MRPVAILFAKAPVPGNVKTRLCPPLDPRTAADLHRAFVEDLLERLQALDADLELHSDVETDAWAHPEVTRRLQIPGDLGLRMFHALTDALAAGRPRAMIIGADLPTVPIPHLRTLLDSAADISLGPTKDGGYYAICAKRTHSRMFDGVAWSTAHALSQTVSACVQCGLSVAVGQPWADVDTESDLRRLLEQPDLPEQTRRWAALHGPLFQ